MASPSYDDGLCFMEWPEGDWLWMQNKAYCKASSPGTDALSCRWDLAQGWKNTRTPVPVPKDRAGPITFTCDNQLHDLGWSEPDLLTNRYICDCGRALSSTANCTGRCDLPWTASFNKRCNVVTNKVTKGNFSTYGGNQGTCLSVAGTRPVQVGQFNPFDIPPENARAGDLLVIDGFGLTQTCSPDNVDRGNGRMCNCDGALPEYFRGQPVLNRDACGLEKHEKAWIAGPVVGGVALLVAVGIALFLFNKKKHSKEFKRRTSVQVDEIALVEMGNRGNVPHRRDARAPIPTETTSVFSSNSQESYDSGVSMVPLAARSEGKERSLVL